MILMKRWESLCDTKMSAIDQVSTISNEITRKTDLEHETLFQNCFTKGLFESDAAISSSAISLGDGAMHARDMAEQKHNLRRTCAHLSNVPPIRHVVWSRLVCLKGSVQDH